MSDIVRASILTLTKHEDNWSRSIIVFKAPLVILSLISKTNYEGTRGWETSNSKLTWLLTIFNIFVLYIVYMFGGAFCLLLKKLLRILY